MRPSKSLHWTPLHEYCQAALSDDCRCDVQERNISQAAGLMYCRSMKRAASQAGAKGCAAHQRFSGSSKKGFARATDTICQVYSLSLSGIPSMNFEKMSRNPACIRLQRRRPIRHSNCMAPCLRQPVKPNIAHACKGDSGVPSCAGRSSLVFGSCKGRVQLIYLLKVQLQALLQMWQISESSYPAGVPMSGLICPDHSRVAHTLDSFVWKSLTRAIRDGGHLV